MTGGIFRFSCGLSLSPSRAMPPGRCCLSPVLRISWGNHGSFGALGAYAPLLDPDSPRAFVACPAGLSSIILHRLRAGREKRPGFCIRPFTVFSVLTHSHWYQPVHQGQGGHVLHIPLLSPDTGGVPGDFPGLRDWAGDWDLLSLHLPWSLPLTPDSGNYFQGLRTTYRKIFPSGTPSAVFSM